MKAIFDDMLKEGEDWFAIGVSGKSEIILPYYMPHFYEKMKQKKISSKVLFVDIDETRELKKKLNKYGEINIRFLPKSISNLIQRKSKPRSLGRGLALLDFLL